MPFEMVWMIDERVWAELVSYGPWISHVRYVTDGIEYDTWVENDEFKLWEDYGIAHEQD